MAKKEARIPIGKSEALIKNSTIKVALEGSDGVEMVIRPTLPLSEVLEFVESVVSTVVDMEDGSYVPEAMWFSIYTEVLTRYANFNLPSDISKQYELVYCTDIFNQVLQHINENQYDEIIDAIQRRVDHQKKLIENTMAAQLKEIVDRMENFATQSEAVFGGISTEDMSAIARNLSKVDQVDETKLVQAVFNSQNKQSTEAGNVTPLPIKK